MNLSHKVVDTIGTATISYSWFKWDLPYSVRYKRNSMVVWLGSEQQARDYIVFAEECRENALMRELRGK